MKYRILSHIADLKIEVYGKTVEELFINAAEALAYILAPSIKNLMAGRPGKISTSLQEFIQIQSGDLNALLVDFLNEILSKSHINKAVYFVDNLKIKNQRVEAGLSVFRVDKFEEDVKAVTYHETNIEQKADHWQTKLVLDI